MSEIEVYHSFDEAPLDSPPAWEGDDSLHAHDLGAGMAASLLMPPQPTVGPPEATRKLVVPHPRDLKRGMSGKDVMALQRALSRAGYHSWNLRTGQFGAQLEKDVRRFQTAKKIKADGVYGQATHAKLAPSYTAYEIDLILQAVENPIHKAQRLFLAAAMQLYNMRYVVHYTQGGARMWIVRHHVKTVKELSKATSVYEDCSSGVTGLYYMAGVPDPNGFGYNCLGYTGTLSLHGGRVTKPVVGALGFYGPWYPWQHVVGLVSAPGKPWRVFSHGSESGPYLLPADYRGNPSQWRAYPGMH